MTSGTSSAASPDPARDLRIAQTEVLTLLHRLPVLGAVEKELRLADDAIRTAQTAHQGVEIDNLLDSIGRSGLLAVPEGGVGDEDLLRRIDRHDLVVEIDPAHLVIGEDILLEIRLRQYPSDRISRTVVCS